MKLFMLAIFSLFQGSFQNAQAAIYAPDRIWPTSTIPVCFMKESFRQSAYQEFRKLLELVVKTEYAPTGIQLTGWGECSTSWWGGTSGPRIAIELGARLSSEIGGHSSVGPATSEPNLSYAEFLGPQIGQDAFLALANTPSELKDLNDFMLKSYQCAVRSPGTHDLRACDKIHRIARFKQEIHFSTVMVYLRVFVHEIGHALGLTHEQNRTDVKWPARGKCFSPFEPSPINDPFYITHPKNAIDCDSVMLTSLIPQVNGSPFLSKHDIEALRRAYKTK